MGARITLKQVAQQSGVSIQTASQILRGNCKAFKSATRQRVLEVADELQYQPDIAGRTLAGGSTMSVGLIARALGGRAGVTRLRSAVEAARQHQYLTYLVNLERRGDNSAQVQDAAKQLISRRVDGLLIDQSVPLNQAVQQYLTSQSIPVIFVGWAPPQWPWHIRFDLDQGIEQVAEHLADLGHRCVAKFFTPAALDHVQYQMVRFKRAFERRGITMLADERWMLRSDMDVEPWAYEAVQRFLTQNTDATAILMNNDLGAIGAMAAVQDAGLSVPADISVVGFDDIMASRFCTPMLTTIRGPDPHRAGQLGFQMLQKLMAKPDTHVEPAVLETRLVVRESTAPPSSRARELIAADAIAQQAVRREIPQSTDN